MALLSPNATFPSYRALCAEYLKALGIRVLLLDIDNTLAPYEQPDPDEALIEWLASMEQAGIVTAFLSNNHGARTERFNKPLCRPIRYDALKPLPWRAKKLFKSLGGSKKTTAFLGDQIFTDVLCAHLCGAVGFLVPPIKDRTDRGTRLKRWFEARILKRYYKKHKNETDIRLGSPLTAEFAARQAKGGEE